MSVDLKIKIDHFEFTMDEAKKLYTDLHEIFGKDSIIYPPSEVKTPVDIDPGFLVPISQTKPVFACPPDTDEFPLGPEEDWEL